MQGLVTKFGDAVWRPQNSAIPPLPTLAFPTTLWAYLGESLARSQNMVAGAPAVTAVGSPAFPPTNNFVSVGPTSATVRGNGYLDTGVPDDTRSFTVVFAARMNSTGGQGAPIANNDPIGSGFGINVQFISGVTPGPQCSINGPAIALKVPATSPGDQTWFKLYLFAYDDPSFTMAGYNLTDGTNVQQVGSSFARNLSTTGTFWTGTNQRFTTALGVLDVAFIGKLSGMVNATQAQAIGANIRAHLALIGLMV